MTNPIDDIEKAWAEYSSSIDYKYHAEGAFKDGYTAGYNAHKAQTGWCFDMEKAPRHKDLVVYREDAGVFMAVWTYIEGDRHRFGLSENVDDDCGLTEEELWKSDWFDLEFKNRLEGSEVPTAWMLPPTPPKETT